ncbi:MAG TPA: dihydroorotate dehydrogenase (quinone), partial [Alphaproteobacteria bacterium]|nr:dihydroorotate dehydrogenase (quinone) [Alphaproteobacteria bacterium]
MHDLMFRLARPVLFGFDPETAHRLSLWALKSGLAGSRAGPDDAVLATRVWGLEFPNPVGLAAGFDKDAEAVDALLGIGFGFVEAGTVTPEPQPGNPRPRLFRLADDEAIVNRLGFNSGGLAVFAAHLSRRRGRGGIVGANLGKNRDAPDAVADFVTGARALCALADYLVINVSSPNTPGLRDLQDRAAILNLVDHVRTAMAEAAT